MVGESADERASLHDITKVCQQHPLEGTTAEEEVDKLVTYVMGTAPEVHVHVITSQYEKIISFMPHPTLPRPALLI